MFAHYKEEERFTDPSWSAPGSDREISALSFPARAKAIVASRRRMPTTFHVWNFRNRIGSMTLPAFLRPAPLRSVGWTAGLYLRWLLLDWAIEAIWPTWTLQLAVLRNQYILLTKACCHIRNNNKRSFRILHLIFRSLLPIDDLVRQSLEPGNPSWETTLVALPSHRAVGIPDRKNQTSNGPNECYIRSWVDFTPCRRNSTVGGSDYVITASDTAFIQTSPLAFRVEKGGKSSTL